MRRQRTFQTLLAILLLCARAGGTPAEGLPVGLYKALEQAQKQLQEGHPRQARKTLDKVKSRFHGNYPRAVLEQTYGYVYLDLDRPELAAASFRKALERDALPKSASRDLRYNLALVLVGLGRGKQALGLLETYLRESQAPDLQGRLLLARLYLQQHRYQRATRLLSGVAAGLRKVADKERVVRLLLVAYEQQGKHAKAVSALRTLLRYDPKRREYWLRLADNWLAMGQEAQALSALEGAYLLGLLDHAGEITALARLYLRQGVPYKAGRLLQRELAGGRLRADGDTLDLMARAWQMAREETDAIRALEQLLRVAPKPAVYARLAALYLDREDWRQAIRTLQAALEHAPDERRGQLLLQLGLAHYRQGQLDQARAAFARIQEAAPEGQQARRWLQYLESVPS